MNPKIAPVKWAQRNDLIYLKFEVQDVECPEVKVENDKIIYRAVTKDNQKYETVLNLFDEIKPEESKWSNADRGAEVVLMKKTPGPYWKRLLKDDSKHHWIKVDFNRWKDEDESEDEASGTNFEEMMRQMGGLGGGMGGSPFNNLDDFDEDEKDSDDENIPDLEEGGDTTAPQNDDEPENKKD